MEGREITPGSEQPRRRLGREILDKYEDDRLAEAMDEMFDDEEDDDDEDDLEDDFDEDDEDDEDDQDLDAF